MRALVLSFMHPDIVPGGAQQVAYNLHLGLQRAGHQSFFTAFHDRLPARLVSDATPLVKMPQRENEYIVNVSGFDYERFVSSSRWLLEAYIRFAKGIQPDVIFAHHFMLCGIDFLVALRKAFPAAKFVFTAHEFLPICKRDGHLVRTNGQLCTSYTPFDCIGCFPNAEPKDFSVRYRMFHKLFDICDVVVTPSLFQGEIMAKHFDFGDRLAVISNGSFNEFSHAHNGASRGQRGESIGFFGQVLRDKGIGFLLQQLPALLNNRKQLKVHIWGSGLDMNPGNFAEKVQQAMGQLGQAFGADRIALRGAYDNRRVIDLMANYDCLVFPSLWPETFSMVFSEAMVAGCKIIAPSLGAFKERAAEAGGNAYLYKLGDPLSFSVAVNSALSTPYKPLGEDDGEALTIDAMTTSYLRIVGEEPIVSEDDMIDMAGMLTAADEEDEAPEAPVVPGLDLDLDFDFGADAEPSFGHETVSEEVFLSRFEARTEDDVAQPAQVTPDTAEPSLAPEPSVEQVSPPPRAQKPRSWQPSNQFERSNVNPFDDPVAVASPARSLATPNTPTRTPKRTDGDGENKRKRFRNS